MNGLQIQDVNTFYGESQILHGVTLDFKPSTVTAVLGRNGVGKTTLVRTIVGFTPPRTGKVIFANREIQRLPAHEITRLGIGLVPQGRRIFRSLSVTENLRLAGQASAKGGRWDMEKIFELFPRLAQRRNNYGDQLSGGEQQMLAIGRALMGNPQMLLMDEPTEGLAPVIVERVRDTILSLKAMGYSILLVEQNLPMALAAADTAYIISKGQVVWHGEAAEIRRNEQLRNQHLAV